MVSEDKMPVKVRIINIVTDELIQEFSSISVAAEFVKNLAKERLERLYKELYFGFDIRFDRSYS